VITKQDILARAREWKLRPEVVEKDYVLGWLLAALSQDEEAGNQWVLKGGTCVKKCFFETYRFSEDLDFSLYPEATYSVEAIGNVLVRVATEAAELSGLDMPAERVTVRERHDKTGRPTFEGGIAYKGPLEFPSWQRIRFDITIHEPIIDDPVLRAVLHPYPDTLPAECAVQTYSFEELLAEKTRALVERARPRDLYDVVYIADNYAAIDRARLRELFQQKCRVKQLEPPGRRELVDRVNQSDEIRADWVHMLDHQLPELVPIDTVVARLFNALSWIDAAEPVSPSRLSAIRPQGGETAVTAPGVRLWRESVPLETLRFAGANRLLIRFSYHGKVRRAEPYSLLQASTGNLLLYAHEVDATHIKQFKVAEMRDLEVTEIPFVPRYAIELGLVSVAPPSMTRRRRPTRTRGRMRGSGPVYVFECPVCGKHFRRKKNDRTLRRHVFPNSTTQCSGRHGFLVRMA
jgi:predicted nucleotidyltransferase component of viral defense system